MQYKYTWDINGKQFSKWDWLALASPRLQQGSEPQEATTYRAMRAWEKHLQTGTIVLSDKEETSFWETKSNQIGESILSQQKGKESIGLFIGCTHCHNIHVTEGDGFPSMHISGEFFTQASKQCISIFNRRNLIVNES